MKSLAEEKEHIVCSRGCEIQVVDNEDFPVFKGYGCRRKLEFAKNDLFNPKRITAVLASNDRLMPMKADIPIQLQDFEEVIRFVKGVVIEKPIEQVGSAFKHVTGTGTNLIAADTLRVIQHV
ncbi:MAG: DUF1667 domain-containing protein [Pseudothermotoga sp.]